MEIAQNLVRYCIEQVRSTRVLRYLIAGGTAAMVDFVLLYALTDIFHIWYLASSVVAFSASLVTSFTLQKFWTFRNQSLTNIHRQFAITLPVAVMNLALSTAFMYLFVGTLGFHYLLARVVVLSIIAFESYLINKHIIFGA